MVGVEKEERLSTPWKRSLIFRHPWLQLNLVTAFKEALLGFLNGVLVGITAGLGMYLYASSQGNPNALMLGVVTLLAMAGSCAVSGVSGVLVPTTLKRFGADPATASSMFLTTATDVISMGAFLGLATLLLL